MILICILLYRCVHDFVDALLSAPVYRRFIHRPTCHYPKRPSSIARDERFEPYFDDSLGAMDGSHITVRVSKEKQDVYRCRKGTITVNLLAVCTFDMRFSFLYSGYEGSANDACVFHEARRQSFIIPKGRYFLGDAGYPLGMSSLTPYRGVRYHLKDFRGSGNE